MTEEAKIIFEDIKVVIPFTLGTYSFELGYSTPIGYIGGAE